MATVWYCKTKTITKMWFVDWMICGVIEWIPAYLSQTTFNSTHGDLSYILLSMRFLTQFIVVSWIYSITLDTGWKSKPAFGSTYCISNAIAARLVALEWQATPSAIVSLTITTVKVNSSQRRRVRVRTVPSREQG